MCKVLKEGKEVVQDCRERGKKGVQSFKGRKVGCVGI